MEHSVLGGSAKYPLKEPFVQLLKGSFNTFLNAFTSPDRTTYPVASTNLKDFYNLVDVYLDAVFHPLITRHHLDQEGWHYELETPDGSLGFRGIVFNEMKGVYSSPEARLQRTAQQALFPDVAYSHDAGGNPVHIPELSYAQFRAFHAAFYHPSNARFFFHGNDAPEERLRRLAAVIDAFDARPPGAVVPLQPAFAEPRQVAGAYGVDPGADIARRNLVHMTWALPEITDPVIAMELGLLSFVLLSTQASPLRKTLVDSGLGEDVSGGGLGSSLRQMTFAVGLKNVREADTPRVEPLILAALEQLAQEGFEAEMIEAGLNTIEFSLRENNTGSFPVGLSLFLRSLSEWIYGHDPLRPLRWEADLARLKATMATDPAVLQKHLRTYLLENNHRVTTILRPDAGFNVRLAAAEQERLAAAKAAMTPAELAAIIANTQALQERQQRPDSPEELALLPRLQRSDLALENTPIPSQVSDGDGVTRLFHDLPTNGIVYFRLGFELSTLPQRLLPYVPFFVRALNEMGTETESYVRLSQRINRKTGGVGGSTWISPVWDTPQGAARFFLRGKATVAQTGELLAILRDMLLTVRLDDRERFRQIVQRTKARLEAGLVPSGNAYVGGRLRAGYTVAGWAEEEIDGVEFLHFVRRLAAAVETDWPGVLAALREVHRHLVNREGLLVDVTLDGENYQRIAPQIDEFLAGLPRFAVTSQPWAPQWNQANEGLQVPAQVNYVGQSSHLYDVGYRYHGSIHVITNFIRTSWLWDQVRAQGGAYGASCSFGRHSGVMTFTSYRDPNLLKTLDAYAQTAPSRTWTPTCCPTPRARRR
jgi:Zn-dependent M16 (insulinase) family peptidase